MRHKPYQASRSRAENFTFYLRYLHVLQVSVSTQRATTFTPFQHLPLSRRPRRPPYPRQAHIDSPTSTCHHHETIETDASRRKTSLPTAQHSTVQRSAAQGLHCQSRQSAEGSSLEHLIPVTLLNGEGVDEIDDWSERASDSCTVDSPL